MSFRLLEAPALMLVAIARHIRDAWLGVTMKPVPKPTVKPKNPNRVAGGKKAAITRKRNKEAREFTVMQQPGDFDEDAIRNAGYAQ